MLESEFRIIADYHTHTLYSHGKGTIMDNVLAAKKKGLKRVAIADHGPAHLLYGIRKRDFSEIRREIDEINKNIQDVEVLMGVECNIIGLDGSIDLPYELEDKLDILLVGFHAGALPKSFKDFIYLNLLNLLARYLPFLRRYSRKYNTIAYVNAIEKYPIDIITHPGMKAEVDTRVLAKAAARHNTALEINAGHGYMTEEYIKIAKEEGARFCINSDAHDPERVGDFGRGLRIAQKAGLSSSDIINAGVIR
ncbi:putative hydrolase [Caldanaerobius fijiensis DSM 17918]|uniref:Putative hydrolase n=1 Tax=Caldanaerobius fijiensis DSM 17918 TaxID=1121256 RepID=A0A1M5B0J4_9THEO|nr:putative hydrolase [Caldanaerobius fijiensis DSM 17918]